MQYLKANNGVVATYPYSIGQLWKDNPNTSFPKIPSEQLLAEWDVYPVTVDEIPVYNSLTQNAEQDDPQNVDDQWSVAWIVSNLDQSVAEQNVRNRRTQLLTESDWMALSDVTITTEWADYRQSLRDITSQEGFPYNVIWPVKP